MVLRSFKGVFPQIHPTAYIDKTAVVIGNVEVGDSSSVWPSAVIRGDISRISIGKGSSIQDNVSIHTDMKYCVEIGDYVIVGHNCVIHGSKIGNYVVVGMGAILMNGVEVGSESVIGAGSVVTEGNKIPERSLVIGIPGKVVKKVDDATVGRIKRGSEIYVDLARHHKLGEERT
ncbi:MAG: gamma carbonic anhydrase family protein [Promethearchaeota archaeon]